MTANAVVMIRALKTLTAIATLALAAGCATVPGVEVVPVPVSPAASAAPVMPARPDLAIARITSSTAAPEVMRLYRESLEQLTGYAEQLEVLLKSWGDKK